MMMNILAVQRLYGLPFESPLTGDNHHFGFNANIKGEIGRFYDFSINKNPSSPSGRPACTTRSTCRNSSRTR